MQAATESARNSRLAQCVKRCRLEGDADVSSRQCLCSGVCHVACYFKYLVTRRRPVCEEVSTLAEAPSLVVDVNGARPLAAIARLRAVLPGDPAERVDWLKHARVAAATGSCPKSHDSFKSGVVYICLQMVPALTVCVCQRPEALVRICCNSLWECRAGFSPYH